MELIVNINPSTSIAEIAVQLPRATKVFEDLKIDYCCGGAKPLNEACENAGVSVANVVQMLERADREPGAEEFDPKTASMIRLIMHILDKHHVYVKKEMARINGLLPKVIAAHRRRHPELLQVADVFRKLCEDIKPHMFKEEQIFFPYIVELERSKREKAPQPIAPFGSASSPIRIMAAEHSEAGEVLRELRRLTTNYTVPEDGCLSFHTLYEALKAFEEDLHQHIHLENNVLFPRAIEMEDRR
jgi:regulator of cell morphogenesis and NO signaling